MGLHRHELSENFATTWWDQDSKNTATSLLNGLTNYDFIVVFLVAYHFLSHLSGITVKLQVLPLTLMLISRLTK